MKQWLNGTLLYFVAGILFCGQIVLCALFYNWAGLDALLYLGWAILAVGIVLVVMARSVFERKGEAPEGKSWLSTTVVVDSGIYAVVRHPMYLSFMLLALALILICQHWLSAIFGVIVMVLLYDVMQQEEKGNVERFGDAYKRYMQSVPRMNLVVGVTRLAQRRRRE